MLINQSALNRGLDLSKSHSYRQFYFRTGNIGHSLFSIREKAKVLF